MTASGGRRRRRSTRIVARRSDGVSDSSAAPLPGVVEPAATREHHGGWPTHVYEYCVDKSSNVQRQFVMVTDHRC